MAPIVDPNIPMSDQTGSATTVPYLSRSVLERLAITTHEAIDSIEQLILGQRRGQVWCAPKVVVLPGDDRYIMATLAVADEPRVVATKSLVLNPRNRDRGISVINSLVTLLDSETGLPLAIVEGNWVTARRTAGLSAIAAKRLARSGLGQHRLHRLRGRGTQPSGCVLRSLSGARDPRLRTRRRKPRRAVPDCRSARPHRHRQQDRARSGRGGRPHRDLGDPGAQSRALPGCALAEAWGFPHQHRPCPALGGRRHGGVPAHRDRRPGAGSQDEQAHGPAGAGRRRPVRPGERRDRGPRRRRGTNGLRVPRSSPSAQRMQILE